jgi:hypothetical protein
MTTKNGAIIALLCFTATTNAIHLNQEHKLAANEQGIFGKMIEMATAGESNEKEKHANTMRK